MLNGKMDENTQAIYEQLKADNPENLTDAELMAQAESQAYSQAVMSQWRSKAIDDTYEPGSTFKALDVYKRQGLGRSWIPILPEWVRRS